MSEGELLEPAKMKIIQNTNPMRQRVNLLHARRKWSDWSECSEECFKTRHRLNCDDIVQAGENVATTTESNNVKQLGADSGSLSKLHPPRSEASKRQALGAGRGSKERSSPAGAAQQNDHEDEDELLYKADQADDDDYADEGDEEDETDSCSNVDPSKTFEKSACLGGSCRLPLLAPTGSLTGLANPETNPRQISTSGGSIRRKQFRAEERRKQLLSPASINDEGKLHDRSPVVYYLQRAFFSSIVNVMISSVLESVGQVQI